MPLFTEPVPPSPDYKYNPDIADITHIEYRSGKNKPEEPSNVRWAPVFASLMMTVRDGQPVQLRASTLEPRTASIEWRPDPKYGHQKIRFSRDQQRWGPEPADHPALTHTIGSADSSWPNRIDHLLEAITEEWPIFIYRHDGLGIITWDRQSHGNWPMLTLDESDWLTIYYQGHPELLKHRQETTVTLEPAAQAG